MKIKNKELDQLIADTQGVIGHINYMQEALEQLEKRVSYVQYKAIEAKKKEGR